MARRRRRHHRRSRSLMNPFSAKGLLSTPKEMLSKEFLVESVSTAAGFMAPNILMGYLPATMRSSKPLFYLSKVGVVAVLAGVTSTVNKKAGRFVLIGGGVSLLLDLWAEWKAHSMTPTAPAPAAGTSAYYGPGGMGAFYGDGGGMGDALVLTDSPQGTF